MSFRTYYTCVALFWVAVVAAVAVAVAVVVVIV